MAKIRIFLFHLCSNSKKYLQFSLNVFQIQMRFHVDFEPRVPSVRVTLSTNDILKASQKVQKSGATL